MRQALARFRAVRTAIGEADQMGGDVKPIQISLRGPELARLEPISEQAHGRRCAQVPGAADVDTSEEQPQAEVRVAVNRKAAGDLGLDLGTVASTMRGLVAGEVVSQFEDPDGDSYDVRLRVERRRAHAAPSTCWGSTCPRRAAARWCPPARWPRSKPARRPPRSAAAT